MNDLNNVDRIKDNTSQESPSFDVKYFPQTEPIMKSLNEMFPEQVYENKTTEKVKEILGANYSTEDVKATIASFDYLINSWLEEYEKKVFSGITMKELLQSI
ncbi:hypothetical protein BH11PAT1_BH11PAT1_5240 [soil metagenome]